MLFGVVYYWHQLGLYVALNVIHRRTEKKKDEKKDRGGEIGAVVIQFINCLGNSIIIQTILIQVLSSLFI